MSTWEERMADRAKERARFRSAEERAAGTARDDDGFAMVCGTGDAVFAVDAMPGTGVVSFAVHGAAGKRCGASLAVERDEPDQTYGTIGMILYCTRRPHRDGLHRNDCVQPSREWDDLPSMD